MLCKTATRVRQASIRLIKMFVTIEPHGIYFFIKFLSVYAVQPCGYATLFLHVQKAGFLMTRLIIWKPKITQACSCIMQRSLKAIKMIIFRVDSHWGGSSESAQYVSEKNAQMHALYSRSRIKCQSGTPFILTF